MTVYWPGIAAIVLFDAVVVLLALRVTRRWETDGVTGDIHTIERNIRWATAIMTAAVANVGLILVHRALL